MISLKDTLSFINLWPKNIVIENIKNNIKAKIIKPREFSIITDDLPWNSKGFTSITLNQRNVSFNPSKDNVAKIIDKNNTDKEGNVLIFLSWEPKKPIWILPSIIQIHDNLDSNP